MRYITIAYGNEKQWAPMLSAWIERFRANIGAYAELVVVSDGSEWVDGCGEKVAHFTDLPEVKGNLNTSGLLLAHAAKEFAPCLVVTLDVMPQHPAGCIGGAWVEADIALGEDPADRNYPDLFKGPELNCAVAWFGKPYVGARFIFEWVVNLEDPRARSIPFWEQVIWSKVYYEIEKGVGTAALYPREMNWSHWWKPNPDASFYHNHGRKKWGMYQ